MGKVLKNPQILLAVALIYLCVCNLVWIHKDSRPPFWDAAYHQAKAIQVSNALHTLGLSGLLAIPRSTGYYPPLFHCIVALFYALFGKSSHSGMLANLPAIALLLYATYGLGKRLLPPHAAVAGAVLVSFFPFMLWLSRETVIDYWLTSMVTLAILCLLETEGFSKVPESVIFGVVCGLGMLTKWTFPIYVAVPAIWAVGKSWKNAALAALTAAAISAFWYWPQWPILAAFLKINSAGGAAKGDPSGLSPQALIFYVRALEGYQLFLPLFILFVAGFVSLLRRFLPAWIPIILWLASGWCGLLWFQNKDPRYSMPLLPAVALISACFFRDRRKWLPVLAVFLLFQHYLVSFGIRQLPERVVLLKATEGRLSWDWNLYSQTYFRMVGPPAREDWKIEPLLARMAKPGGPVVKIGLAFNIPRFDAEAFEFYGALHHQPIEVTRLWDFNEDAIANQSFILLCEADQGNAAFYSNAEMERQLKNLHQISQFILDRPERFQFIDRFAVPSGETIRLYRPKS